MKHIDEKEPLPSLPEPSGHWAEPYVSRETGLWTVYTRRPLTQKQVQAGLASCLTASNRETLNAGMAREEERARQVAAAPDPVPVWSHRA